MGEGRCLKYNLLILLENASYNELARAPKAGVLKNVFKFDIQNSFQKNFTPDPNKIINTPLIESPKFSKKWKKHATFF